MNINTSAPIEPSVVNRTFDAHYTANGKGLNVSYVLKHYGVPSKILGFFGGFSGKFIVDTFNNVHHIPVLPVTIDDITRVNVFLFDGSDEYKMVNEGSLVDMQHQDKLIMQLESLDDLDVLSISGSLPKGVGPDLYNRVLQTCADKGAKVVLDISHKSLSDWLDFQPYLIKPNDEEIQDIFGWEIASEDDVVEVLHKLHERGAQNILLTLGDKGMYFYCGVQGDNYKKIFYASVPPAKVLSSVCAGDSSLAAFMANWKFGEGDIERAMKCACATGADVAMSQGIGDLARVSDFVSQATFREVE